MWIMLLLGYLVGLMHPIRHDFHSSITEIKYKAATKTCEVTMRLFTDDMEEALRRATQATAIHLDKSSKYDAQLQQYLQRHFSLTDPKSQSQALRWVGKEVESEVVWLYFEIACKRALAAGWTIHNAVLTELFADQMNIVNVVIGSQKQTYLCQRSQPRHTLK